MNDLEKCRLIIDEEDEIIREAFLKRMKAVEGVIKYKKENNLKILDSSREKSIIDSALAKINDVRMKKYYEALIKEIMAISKEYQKELLNE